MQSWTNKPGAAQCSPLCLLSCHKGQHQCSSCGHQLLNQDPIKTRQTSRVSLSPWNESTQKPCGSANPAQKERESGNLFLLGGRKLLGERQCSCKQPAASGCWRVLVSWWTLVLLTHSLPFAVRLRYLFCIQHIWTSREHVGICV